VKKQVPIAIIVAPALLILAAVGYFLLIKPKQSEAAKISDEITSIQTQIDVTRAAQRQPQQDDPSAIKIADLFKVTQAMPDDDDMPGIILELNDVATAAGVEFVSIAPQGGSVRSGYSALPINLTFEGNYFDLTDFLFRLRNLVRVRDGELGADGRLFTLETLTMEEGPLGFPEITASLTVTAYVYSTTPPAAAPAAPAAPGSTDTTQTGATDTTATTTAPTTTTTPAPGGEITP
jgi:Tfp pilus assembly protein PilO